MKNAYPNTVKDGSGISTPPRRPKIEPKEWYSVVCGVYGIGEHIPKVEAEGWTFHSMTGVGSHNVVALFSKGSR